MLKPPIEGVSDVHDVLKTAAFIDATPASHTTRMNPQAKAQAEAICKKNGTTLSAFLRESVYALVRDYGGARPEEPK